ncbi:diaminopimelate epimerase [Gracilibacillus boraciitolerans JCM 21714]|uniref:Diaminopimelate epimerase n=1 Tax=Gracilibacillus boraciitolerans JCM 21714 TaxID=1298598 RepID=W4VKU3_9BACI|nr:diaminopimelate epimerase [Gracilibacillus boraciitolerans]GAE93995.1 diaminopimelate epimerase [Gracilibacillus boraciitolerans JCM 21714]
MKIPFTKMHGLGNSYIFINIFDFFIEEGLLADLAIAAANKDIGIGSDGLILIHPTDKADVGMRIFNKDGSEGKNCGNGLRCVAKYAYEHEMVKDKKFTIETKAGNVIAEVHGDRNYVSEVTVDMGLPLLKRSEIPMAGGEPMEQVVAEPFTINDDKLEVTTVSMGNPHAVFFVNDIDAAPLTTLGPVIEKDPRFPEGVNVEFIEKVNEEEIHFRVWERGSGITQACGTGACAAVVASVLNGQLEKGKEVTVHLAGGDLFITWSEDQHVWMRGKAETTIDGIFFW